MCLSAVICLSVSSVVGLKGWSGVLVQCLVGCMELILRLEHTVAVYSVLVAVDMVL